MGAGGLIATSEDYSFDELVQLRKLRDLAATRISVKSIRAVSGCDAEGFWHGEPADGVGCGAAWIAAGVSAVAGRWWTR